jgi:hypothetical protein
VKRGFTYEAGMQPERYRLIDAGRDIDAVHRDVRREAARLLAARGWTLTTEG